MSNAAESNSRAVGGGRNWLARIGPGLITACVVIGPGSILTSSKTGANHGFTMAWVVVVAVCFMMAFLVMGAKLGVMAGQSTGNLITQRTGRWLAVAIGVGVFFISATFQFGNNLGVDSAFAVYLDELDVSYKGLFEYVVVAFNVLSIAFLFGFRNLYRALERLMMVLVALLLICFAANLTFAFMNSQPAPGEVLRGFVPPNPRTTESRLDWSLLGLVGTTFVITAAYYQAYLVQQKGWGREELADGVVDARISAILMVLITLMIMFTSAAMLRGQTLEKVGQVAEQLKPLFGEKGRIFFCLGLFAAAYSSFLVNSMIGGFILSDGLGLGSRPTDLWPRILTAGVLLIGMTMALYVIKSGRKPIGAIVVAQAVTVLAAPLMAGALIWLTNCRDIMGTARNGLLLNIVAGFGFVVLLLMAGTIAVGKVWPAVVAFFG